MNLKIIAKIVIPSLALTACGTKYSSTNTVLKPKVIAVETPTTVTPTEPSEPPVPQIEPTTSVPPDEAVQSLPAAIALRDEASIATTAKDYQRAIGLLERALRISPDDPQTFFALAQNHLAMEQPQQALQLARRGLTLNPTNAQRNALETLVSQSEAAL